MGFVSKWYKKPPVYIRAVENLYLVRRLSTISTLFLERSSRKGDGNLG
jgi:hypothetical protein